MENINGIPGTVDYGFNYKEREITLKFQMEHFNGSYDFRLMRNQLYALLDSQSYFYIVDNLSPSLALKITIDSSYLPNAMVVVFYIRNYSKTTGLPFWRTIYTTQDIEKNGYTALVEKFGMADGVHLDYLTYTPKTNTFSIWNGGNVAIDPRHFDLSIRLLYATSKGNVTIENLTTGEKFIFIANLKIHLKYIRLTSIIGEYKLVKKVTVNLFL